MQGVPPWVGGWCCGERPMSFCLGGREDGERTTKCGIWRWGVCPPRGSNANGSSAAGKGPEGSYKVIGAALVHNLMYGEGTLHSPTERIILP